MKTEVLAALLEAQQAKRPVALVTELPSGVQRLLTAAEWSGDDPVAGAARDAIRRDACVRLEVEGDESEGDRSVFVQPFNPPLRMLVVGAVHIAQPLTRMAAEAGFEVTVVDPRAAFATEERFPGVARCDDWPDEAMARLAPDARTAIVTLTHDPKLDDPALAAVLRSPVFYIGSLGSKKTHANRVARLREQGFSEEEIAKIHGPVGLDLGAKSPAEIAVSILGEVIATLRQPA